MVTHPTLLLSRGAHSALLVLLASPYRYVTSQTNADWLKISYDSQKRKCAKDPENEIIKQKTSARAEKRMNIVVSTADSLRLTSCHVVSFRFACSLSLSLAHSSLYSFTHNLLSLLAVCQCWLRRLRSVNLVALARPSPRNPKLLSISFGTRAL